MSSSPESLRHRHRKKEKNTVQERALASRNVAFFWWVDPPGGVQPLSQDVVFVRPTGWDKAAGASGSLRLRLRSHEPSLGGLGGRKLVLPDGTGKTNEDALCMVKRLRR